MKKLLGILILSLLFNGNVYAETYDVVLKCEVKNMDSALDFDKAIERFGKPGETTYFHVQESGLVFEVSSGWNKYEKRFIYWHEGDFISKRFIKFGFWPGKREANSHIQISRESGKMSFIGATDEFKDETWYDADCDKINLNDLPTKVVKQKF